MSSSLNIILFGATGVGKSSVINLIAGRKIAETSPDAPQYTASLSLYTLLVNGRTFNIWDTACLEESDDYLAVIKQAYDLIQQLTSRGGVDLLLLCIEANRVNGTTQSRYKLFHEVLCRSKVPIAFVITHLEREWVMEEWWERNEGSLERRYGLKAAGHACVTGLPTHGKYPESRRNIIKLVEGFGNVGRFTMPQDGWLIEFLRSSALPKKLKRKDIQKVLTRDCKLDSKRAKELATKLEGAV